MRILKLNEIDSNEILDRSVRKSTVTDTVTDILENVRLRGDEAVAEYTARFDHVQLDSFTVSTEEIEESWQNTEEDFREVLLEAAENIRLFHQQQKRTGFILNEKEGVVTGQKVIPLEKVGIYVPAGTAAYPSTVLMNAIPAKIAGCKQIILATPPQKDGKASSAILAAAKVAGVDTIYKIGGAQAIAALAFGTESVTRVDKIVGPGNAFVAEAKKQVYGLVSIDMIAGPSEILIIADENSDPEVIAADLLSQSEHDKMSSAVLITDSPILAEKVSLEVDRQLETLPRKEIAQASVDNNGMILIASDISEAIFASNRLAPEHLELQLDNPFDWLDSVTNAGSVFLGRNCPEALGDYLAGPNHTLPTSGTARFFSPLSVDDFTKTMQYTYFSAEALDKVADKVALFAEKEGLSGHARSAIARKKEKA